MSRRVFGVLLVSGVLVAPAVGQTVTQSNRANVYGAVQLNPTSPLIVRQTGIANVAGIVQAGPRNVVSVTQTGAMNRASVGQIKAGDIRNARGMIP